MPNIPQAEIDAVVAQIQLSVVQANVAASMISSLGTGVPPGGPPSTTTSLTATPDRATVGQAVMLIATVTGANPTGNVAFSESQTPLGSATLSAGAALISLSALAVGAHSVTARYAGDSGNAASTSAAVSVTINAAGGPPAGNITIPPAASFTHLGVVWKFEYSGDTAWGDYVSHNGTKDSKAHHIVLDAAADKVKLERGDSRHPEIPYEWVEWTGSGYVATSAP